MGTYGFKQQQGEPNNSANSFGPFYGHGNDISKFTLGHPNGSGNLHAQGYVQGSARMREYHQGPPEVSQHPQQHVLHQGVLYAPDPLEQHMEQFPSQLKFELSLLSSRVETQFFVTFTLSNAQMGVERVRLPRHLISNARFLAKKEEAANLQTLQLRTLLVSADAMESPEIKLETLKEAATGSQESAREVKICPACINREKKRANRKMNKTKEPWNGNEGKRAVLLSGEEYSTWERRQVENGKIDLQLKMPVRIACYCRHHNSKQGFCIIFTLVDCEGRWVAQGMTPPIYITDNHKDAPVKGEKPEEKTTGSYRVHKRSPPAKAGPKNRSARIQRPAKRISKDVPRKRHIRRLQDMPPMGPNNPPPNLAATLGPVCPPTNGFDPNAGIGQTLASHQPESSSNNGLPLGASAHIPNNPQQPFLGEMLPTQQQPNYAYASANAQPQGERAQNIYNVNFVGMARNVYTNHANYASTFGMNQAQTAGANSLNAPGTNPYPNMAADAGYYHTNGGVDLTAFANTGPYNNVGMGSSNMTPQTEPWNFAVMTPNAPNASALNDGAMGQLNMVPFAEPWNALNNGVMPPNAPDASSSNGGAMGQSNTVVNPNPWDNGNTAAFNFPNIPQVAGGHFGITAGIALPNAANMGSLSPPEVGPAGTVNTYTQDVINTYLWNTVNAGSAGMVVTNTQDQFDPEVWNTADGGIFDAEQEFDEEQEASSMSLNDFEFT
ncbi:hypothetical protein IWX90DRAFT_493817 [Phyllosticta citrichinensis]|uniref:SPT23/MGA2-like DNA-binding domain-containing protein n=1 Tax=Phyllosticta citrichinensis TaxID=1130410 RepID=A0ABR1XI00_9PEZI